MATNMLMCPLTRTYIDEYACYLIAEAAEGNIPENEMPGNADFDTEQKICNSCKYHDTN